VALPVRDILHEVIKGSSKRTRKARSLTADDFHRLMSRPEEPFRTIAPVSVSFGLRLSECLALKWQDVAWLNTTLPIRRSIVRQRMDETKTEYNNRPFAIDAAMLNVLETWKQTTQFDPEDSVFASPAQIGRLPWSADAVSDAYIKASKEAGIERVTTHCMRHT